MPKLSGQANLVVARPFGSVVRGARDPVADAMAGAGAGLVGASNELHHAFQVEQARVNRNIVEDTNNKLRNRMMELEVGEGGYSHERSGNAVNKPLLKDYSKRFDDAYKELYEKLSNEEQKEAFSRRYDVAKTQFARGVLGHVTREDGVYRKQVMVSTIDTEKNLAALRWNMKDEIDASNVRVKAKVLEYAKTNDLDKVTTNSLLLTATTKIHGAVIERAINEGQSGYASAWLKENREEIDADTAKVLQASMKTAGTREASQSQADRIMGMNVSDRDKIGLARKVRNAETRAATVNLVKARIAEEQGFIKQDETDAYQEAQGYMASRQAAGHVPVLNDVPISVMERMNGGQQQSIMNQLSGYATTSKPVKASSTYYMLEQMHAADEKQFSEMDMMQFDGKITPEEMTRFIGYQKDTVTGGVEGDIATSKAMVVKQGIAAAGLDVKKMVDGEDELAYQRRFDAEVQALGKDASAADYREIADRLSIEVVNQRPWYRNDIEAPAALWELEGVPQELIDELARAVQAAGQPVTTENIRKLWEYENR